MRFVLFIIAVGYSLSLPAQEIVAIRGHSLSDIYARVENTFSIVAEGYTCSSLVVKSNKATIKKLSDCHFTARVDDTTGYVTIDLYGRKNNELIKLKSFNWTIVSLPLPTPSIGGYPNLATISVAAFKAQAGLACYGVDRFDFSCNTQGFDITVMNNSIIQFTAHNQGAAFSKETLAGIRNLQPGDIVLVSGIMIVVPNGKTLMLKPLEYHIY